MIEINYVISVSSKAEIESKALDEAKIIGKIIQIFKDNPTIPARYMPDNAGAPLENVPVSMLPINMEEKVKVWTMFGESYKLSVFYVVGPVAIDSDNIHKPKKRVETIYLGSNQFERKKELHFATFIKEEDIDDEYTQRPDEDEDEDEEEEDTFGDDSDEDSSDDDSDDDNLISDNDSSNDDSSDDNLISDNDSSDDDSDDDNLISDNDSSNDDSSDDSDDDNLISDDNSSDDSDDDNLISDNDSSDDDSSDNSDDDVTFESSDN
jgi:hypothetical protein